MHNGTSVTIKATARTAGFTAADPFRCSAVNQPGIAKFIGGMMTASLLKLNKVGSGNRPDDYSVCRIVSSGMKPLGAKIELDVQFTAPCGTGFYAQVVCLNNAKTQITDGVSALNGTFNAVNPKTDCMVTPIWHPVGLTDGEVLGPLVKL